VPLAPGDEQEYGPYGQIGWVLSLDNVAPASGLLGVVGEGHGGLFVADQPHLHGVGSTAGDGEDARAGGGADAGSLAGGDRINAGALVALGQTGKGVSLAVLDAGPWRVVVEGDGGRPGDDGVQHAPSGLEGAGLEDLVGVGVEGADLAGAVDGDGVGTTGGAAVGVDEVASGGTVAVEAIGAVADVAVEEPGIQLILSETGLLAHEGGHVLVLEIVLEDVLESNSAINRSTREAPVVTGSDRGAGKGNTPEE